MTKREERLTVATRRLVGDMALIYCGFCGLFGDNTDDHLGEECKPTIVKIDSVQDLIKIGKELAATK